MHLPEWLRPHRDAASLGGWLFLLGVIGRYLWRGAEALDLASAMTDIGPAIGNWLLAPLTALLFLPVGFVLLAYSNRRYGGSALHPQPRGERAQRHAEDEQLALDYRSALQLDNAEIMVALLTDGLAKGESIAWQGVREAGDPHLLFIIPIVNASLHGIDSSAVACDGRVSFEGQALKGPPSVTMETRGHHIVQRGTRASLTIRQELLPEIVNQIRDKAGTRVSFSFSSLAVVFQVLGHSARAEWRVPLLTTLEGWNGTCNPTVPDADFLRTR